MVETQIKPIKLARPELGIGELVQLLKNAGEPTK